MPSFCEVPNACMNCSFQTNANRTTTKIKANTKYKPGLTTLVNGIQCPLRDKILLCPAVSSKTSTGNINDGGLEALHNSSGPPKAPRPPKCPLSLLQGKPSTSFISIHKIHPYSSAVLLQSVKRGGSLAVTRDLDLTSRSRTYQR